MHPTKEAIIDVMKQKGIGEKCYIDMLEYTINLFEVRGLGTKYYGYHNIRHELEVTYIALLALHQQQVPISQEDAKYLYVAALFHDLDPLKNVDKPHEKDVLEFISKDQKLQNLINTANIDFEIVKVLILRTTYPWSGKIKKDAEERAKKCFANSEKARDNEEFQHHIMRIGRYLSVVDRMSGYALGDFTKAMEMAKMNAHALAWNPSIIIQKSVAYFEELLNGEVDILMSILAILPKQMRRNFYNTVLSFFQARQEEITIQAEHAYENLKLIPIIETTSTRWNSEFIKDIREIFMELPVPLQFKKETFNESIKDPHTILTTLRINGPNGKIVGYAKGGPLEHYKLREEIQDKNHGKSNTVFLEPMGLKRGYWGLKGGNSMRNMFIMQATAKKYKYLTSFALREVVEKRTAKEKGLEFVAQFDPERWDYYRMII